MTDVACRIGIERPDGSVRSVRVLTEGTPEEVGSRLLLHWDTEARIEKLLDRGDLRRVGSVLGRAHLWDADPDALAGDWCQFFTRDNGAFENPDGYLARVHPGEFGCLHQAFVSNARYVYLMRDGVWYWLEMTGLTVGAVLAGMTVRWKPLVVLLGGLG